jgi:hypothetical protein
MANTTLPTTTDASRVARPRIRISAQPAVTTAHTRPLDSVIQALDDTRCAWCAGLLKLLKQHIEAGIAGGWEGGQN